MRWILVAALIAGCGKKSDNGECEARVAKAKAALQDAERFPWPTGDAATDALIEDQIKQLRGIGKSKESKAKALATGEPKVFQFGPLVQSCEPAAKVYGRLGELGAGEKLGGLLQILDGIQSCGCQANVELIAAYMYVNRAILAGLTLDADYLKTPSELAK